MPDVTPVVSDETTPETQECENCGVEVSYGDLYHNDRLGAAVCSDCDLSHPELHECRHCGREHEDEDSAYECCRYECPECGTEYHYEEEAVECCQHRCPECGESHYSEEDAANCCRSTGSWYPSLSSLDDPYLITVPVIEGRPARLCSVEQEVTKGGQEATQMLYDYGFAESNELNGYSWSPRRGRVGVCSDGSLPGDGGEIIYSRFLLNEEDDIEMFSKAAGRMRQLAREARVVRVGSAAGTHIHISATAEDGTRLGPTAMAALHEIFCYAEDFIYSVAAAGWDEHRTSPTSHGGYCKPVPKIPYGEKASGFRVNSLMSRDRYYGLNFQRLLSAAGNCSCGAARFGEWEVCECGAFDGATVEWRVFNASTKPETLHAWLLLSHALTALAVRHQVGTLPVNEYGSSSLEERRAVQTWIEQNAPLTDDEVQVIRDAVRRSRRMNEG